MGEIYFKTLDITANQIRPNFRCTNRFGRLLGRKNINLNPGRRLPRRQLRANAWKDSDD